MAGRGPRPYARHPGVKGRSVVVVLLGVLVVALGLVFWLGATGGGRASESGRAQSDGGMARSTPDPFDPASMASAMSHDARAPLGHVDASLEDAGRGAGR